MYYTVDAWSKLQGNVTFWQLKIIKATQNIFLGFFLLLFFFGVCFFLALGFEGFCSGLDFSASVIMNFMKSSGVSMTRLVTRFSTRST